MKLTEIENPLVMDSSKPIYIKTSLGPAKVIGFTPKMYNGRQIGYTDPYWQILVNGTERFVYDGEIIEE